MDKVCGEGGLNCMMVVVSGWCVTDECGRLCMGKAVRPRMEVCLLGGGGDDCEAVVCEKCETCVFRHASRSASIQMNERFRWRRGARE